MENKISLKFTLICIAIYVIVMSASENISFGIEGLPRLIASAVIFTALFVAVKKKNVLSEIGIKPMGSLPFGKLLYFLPMLVLMTVNLWRGAVLRYAPLETALYLVSMMLIGFSEEILFRGLLFNVLLKGSARTAVIVSSLTFGFGHIVNLLDGEELLPTILQVVYAVAIGFMLSAFVLRTKNIVQGMIFHGVFNALSAFANDVGQTAAEKIIISAVISAIAVFYTFWLLKNVPAAEEQH